MAGFVGVAATGVVIVRSERRRRAYTPEEIRNRLHERVAAAEAAEPVAAPEPANRVRRAADRAGQWWHRLRAAAVAARREGT
nr:hypothetical protein [Actinomadura craniellae]